jgi:aminocarboxymuconate-semialdehyde decarboxylase
LGSDYPYPWQLHPVDHVFACSSLSDEEKAAILGQAPEARGARSGAND